MIKMFTRDRMRKSVVFSEQTISLQSHIANFQLRSGFTPRMGLLIYTCMSMCIIYMSLDNSIAMHDVKLAGGIAVICKRGRAQNLREIERGVN